MGFYSFYKIIKDLLRTFFGSKMMKITIALIIAFLLCSYIIPVFATGDSIIVNYNNYDFTFPAFLNDYYWAIYFYKASNGLRLFVVYSDVVLTVNSDGSQVTIPSGTTFGTYGNSSYNNNNQNMQNIINNYLRDTASLSSQTQVITTYSGAFENTLSVFCNYDLKTSDGTIVFPNTQTVSPHFDNTDADIQNLSFEWLFIDPADFGIDEPLYFHLLGVIDSVASGNDTIFYYNDVSYKLDKKSKYFFESEPSDYYSIPRYELSLSLNSVYFFVISSDGSKINQSTNAITTDYDGVYQVISVDTTGILTQDDINNNNIKSITKSSGDTLNEITDSHIDNDFAESLPTDNIQDITSSGIDTIFSSIYTAFTSGTAQDIVFPVPFTDKFITLSATYVSDFLLEYCSWVYALIQAFWGYLIGRFIVTDVMKKMTAIKSGNFDKIQNNNIKGDML